MMPGLAEYIVTLATLAGLSTVILLTAAVFNFPFRKDLIFKSSLSNFVYAPPLAYHLESQVLFIPNLRPIGFTF